MSTRMDTFALLRDPVSGLRMELGRSDDSEIHSRQWPSVQRT